MTVETLHPGYNIVTKRIEDTNEEFSVLEFLRKLAANDPLPERVTVTHFEDLLYHLDQEERYKTIDDLRQLFRNTNSMETDTAVQILTDGRLSDTPRVQIQFDRRGETVILDLGELFVAEPTLMKAHQAVAPK